MCNFVVPIRTCSKCRQREPLFHDMSLRDNEKVGSDEVGDMSSTLALERGNDSDTAVLGLHGHGARLLFALVRL